MSNTDQLVIEGVKPYDGSYDFDLDDEPFTTFEWRVIKKISGYLPLTLVDGWSGGDPDLFEAFALVALVRAGKVDKDDVFDVAARFDEAQLGAIRVISATKEEADASPPPETVEDEGQPPSGGESSSSPSAPSGNGQSSTGHQDLPRSVISDRETLAT